MLDRARERELGQHESGRPSISGGIFLSFVIFVRARSFKIVVRMTMIEERFVRLRTYRNNIARYRRLLKTDLTDSERKFIERRLSEERSECELLDAGNLFHS